MGPGDCVTCGIFRALPLFYIQEGENYLTVCHSCIERAYGRIARERGPWETQLSGAVWLIKVRP